MTNYLVNRYTERNDSYRLENFLPFIYDLFDGLRISLNEPITFEDERKGWQYCTIYFPETDDSTKSEVYIVQKASGLPKKEEGNKKDYLDRLKEAERVHTRMEIIETGSGRGMKLKDLIQSELGI